MIKLGEFPAPVKIGSASRWVDKEIDKFAYKMPPTDISERELTTLLAGSIEIGPFPGVYWLINDKNVIVYVGRSGNCAGRLGGHKEKIFCRARMVRVADVAKRAKFEQILIARLNPLLNIAMTVAT